DKVQLHATLERPGYVYLYWYDAKGKPTRLWPDSSAPLEQQQSVSEVWSPAGAKSNGRTAKGWPIEGETGAQVALGAGADQPVSADELQRFEDQSFVLAGELSRPRQMLEFAHPGLSSGTAVRGLGANPVEAPKRVVPELEPELNLRFRAYRGWLFFQEETK